MGTRLRPLTTNTPKPIVPVLNRPFLLFQIENLLRAGILNIALSISHQSEKIEQILGDGSEFGVDLRFVTEPTPLGTAGACRFAIRNQSDAIIVLNGDILTDIDVSRMIEFHREKGAAATIALFAVEDPSRYGVVVTDGDLRVRQFVEKPNGTAAAKLASSTINAGIYILAPEIVDLIPSNRSISFEYDIFPEILSRGLPFYGYVLDGYYWRDIGSPQSYLAAHHDLLAGTVGGVEGLPLREGAVVDDPDGRSVIGPDCIISPDATVINSVLGPGVQVEEKAVIENSVVWANTLVSCSAHLKASVLGRNCRIGRNVSVPQGSVVGDDALLPDYSII